MPRQSPYTVQYKELLEQAEEVAQQTKARLEGARSRQVTNLDALIHAHEVAKTMVRLFKKGLPGKQTDMYALFEQVK